jgi:hypothetical protein
VFFKSGELETVTVAWWIFGPGSDNPVSRFSNLVIGGSLHNKTPLRRFMPILIAVGIEKSQEVSYISFYKIAHFDDETKGRLPFAERKSAE